MFTRTHAILTVILVALAGSWLCVSVSAEKKRVDEIQRVPFLQQVNVDRISRIEISRQTRDEHVELVRVAGEDGEPEWTVEGLYGFPAASNRIRDFLEKVEEADTGVEVEIGEDKFDYYLLSEEKGIHVRLMTGSQLIAEYWIGKPGPTAGSSYVRMDDGRVLLVYTILSSTADPRQHVWFRRDIWEVDSEQVARITVQQQDKAALVAERTGVEEWMITSPVEIRADAAQIRSMLTSVSFLHLLSVPSPEEAEASGIENPWMTATLTLQDGTVHTLKMGNESQAGRARGRYGTADTLKHVVVLPIHIGDILSKEWSFFVSGRIWKLPSEVRAISYATEDGVTRFQRQAATERFLRTLPTGGAAAKSDALKATLEAVMNLRSDGAEERTDRETFGLTPNCDKLIVDTQGNITAELWIGERKEDYTYVCRPESEVIYRIKNTKLAELTRVFVAGVEELEEPPKKDD